MQHRQWGVKALACMSACVERGWCCANSFRLKFRVGSFDTVPVFVSSYVVMSCVVVIPL
jgi:hypothetical protein